MKSSSKLREYLSENVVVDLDVNSLARVGLLRT